MVPLKWQPSLNDYAFLDFTIVLTDIMAFINATAAMPPISPAAMICNAFKSVRKRAPIAMMSVTGATNFVKATRTCLLLVARSG